MGEFAHKRTEDAKHDEYHAVSQLGLPVDRIPQDILARANKIFSKHQAREVREWGHNLMKTYQLLHAVEKPINFDFVKPFASTSDLQTMLPEIDYTRGAERMEQRLDQMENPDAEES